HLPPLLSHRHEEHPLRAAVPQSRRVGAVVQGRGSGGCGMNEPRRHHRYTYADYVGLEMYSDTKHEFLDGEIYAMAGGSEEHSALAAAMIHALTNAIGDQPCR